MDSPKTQRALDLFKTLQAEAKAFLDSKPVEVHESADGEWRVWRLRQRTPTPDWSCLVGDIIHNLRSSLDHAACQLVTVNGGNVTRRTQFPIAATAEKFRDALREQLGGASPEAMKAVAALRPYKGGNARLFDVHDLDIVDKHRGILLVASCAGQVTTTIKLDFKDHEFESEPLTWNPADYICPITDGAEVFRAHGGYNGSTTFPCYVAFGDGRLRTQNVLVAVKEMGDAVWSALKAVTPLITPEVLEPLLRR